MKTRLLSVLTVFLLFTIPILNFAQAPPLGVAADFALFSSIGAVGITGISHVTGDVGSNDGAVTMSGNINGNVHSADGVSDQCVTDLLNAYNLLDGTIADYTIASPIGNGTILTAGTYSVPGVSSTLTDTLFLDGNANDVFIFKVDGTLSTDPNSKVILINGVLACNVFWKVEGLVSMASGTTMRGTIIANNAAINMSTGDTLEGRALSTNGAVNVAGALVFTPIGCNSPVLTGPAAPALATTVCYALFSSVAGGSGVTDNGTSIVDGDVGTNSGLTTFYDPLLVTGTIHPIPDGSTGTCATDLGNVYTYLNTLPNDIKLLYPAQFGNNLVLTPHTYLLDGATTFTGDLYLNAMDDPNAVFVIQINAALITSTYSKVHLINGALPENVYWKIDGAVEINDYSVFNGTIVSAGAIALKTGVELNGRALTISGALSSVAINNTMPPGCNTSTAPLITAEPTNQQACPGDSISFIVEATGTDLTYQWRKGISPILGATSDTLTINPVNISDAAVNYNVVVSGLIAPADTSINVSLTVNAAPIIIAEPENQTVCLIGDSVSFIVEATGTGLTYQWRKGNNPILGATSDTLTINPVTITDIIDNFNVVVSGTCLPNDTSINISLSLNTAPEITLEPEDQAACAGSSISFSVMATGTDHTYQWRKGISNVINAPGHISGATSATLTINPINISDAANNYYVVVSGACLPNDTSNFASLTVNTAPIITIEPIDQTVCRGSSAKFSVSATGTDLSYQWRKGEMNLIYGSHPSGANTDTLVIEPDRLSEDADNYNVVVSGLCLPNDTSINVSLEIFNAPEIVKQPKHQTACAGNSVSFSVDAVGTNLSFQWRKGETDLTEGEKYFGVTAQRLIINNVDVKDETDNYNVVISGTCLPSVTSNNVSLYVNSSPSIIIESGDQTVCVGNSAKLWVVATGSGFTFQWRKGTENLVDGGNIYGAKTSRLQISPVALSDAADNYNLVVSGSCFTPEISSNVALIIATAPIIKNEPADQNVCLGSSASFTVEATGTGLTYQWRKGTANLSDIDNISGATSNTLVINSVTYNESANDYNVIVSGKCSPGIFSKNVSLEVEKAPNMTIEQGNQKICIGSSANFSVAQAGVGFTYQWRKGSLNLHNGVNISGATSSKLSINPVSNSDAANNYNVVVTGLCFSSETSADVALEVDIAPKITLEPSDQTTCIGSSVSFSVAASGTDLTYQWRKGTAILTNGINISGATTSTLTVNPVKMSDVADNYNVVVTGTCTPGKTSTNASLIVDTTPFIVIEPGNQTVCAGSSVSFSVSAIRSGFTYQWRKGTVNLINGGNITGANSAKLTISPVNTSDAADNYNLVIDGTCFSNAISTNISLVVHAAPNITSEPSDQTTCVGSPAGFSVTATGTELTYQWRKGTVNITNNANIFGANSSVLIISTVGISDAATNYNVVVSGTCSSNKTSKDVSLVVNTMPRINTEPTDQTVCEGSSVNFSVAATGSGLIYQWRKGTVNLSNGGNLTGANSAMLTINPVNVSNTDYNYNVVVTGSCPSKEISKNVYLVVNTAPIITSEPLDQSFCKYGCSISYLVAATGTGLTYQWRKGEVNLVNGGDISGANSAMLTINQVNVSDVTLHYNVIVSGTCSPSVTSVDAFLSECEITDIPNIENENKAVKIYPNPFATSINIMVNDESLVNNCELRIFNVLGEEVVFSNIAKQLTTLETSNLRSGFYFYKVIGKDQVLQSGKLILKK